MKTDFAPLISVILPVFNARQFLVESIESILNQTYRNFELILINDGSTDGSESIIQKFAEIDSRIIVVSHENQGLIKSLNIGLKKSTGEWIARMDADDISISTRLVDQVNWVQYEGVDFCGSWIELFDDQSFSRVKKYITNSNDLEIEALFAPPVAHGAILMRASVVKQLLYDAEYLHAEDYELWVRAIEKGYRFSNIPKVLYRYRFHEDQVSFKSKQEQELCSNRIRARYLKYLVRKLNFTELQEYVLKKFIEEKRICTKKHEYKPLKQALNVLCDNLVSMQSLKTILIRLRNKWLFSQSSLFEKIWFWTVFNLNRFNKFDPTFPVIAIFFSAINLRKNKTLYRWVEIIWLRYLSK